MKKVIVLALAVMMVLAMVPTVAMAADPESEVKATVSSSYTITIPSKVDFGPLAKGETKTKEFIIEASDVVLEPGERIDVTVDSDFLLTAGVATLPYQLLKSGGGVASTGRVYCSFKRSGNYTGTAKVNGNNITAAGVYSDVMVFKIGLNRDIEDVPSGQYFKIGTATRVRDNGYFFELYFQNGRKVGYYKSLKVMAYYNERLKATAVLRDISRYANSTRLTCSFYTDDHISTSWLLEKLPHKNCDTVVLEAVGEDGVTYRFTKTGVPYREPYES